MVDSESGIYYMSLALLYVLRNMDDYSDVSRLAFVLDRDNFDRLIDNCGGMTMKIPTREEVNYALKALMFYQMRYVDSIPMPRVLEECELTPEEAKKIAPISRRISRYFRLLNPNIISMLSGDGNGK